MIMGHEMAHALREHARSRIAKTQGTGALLSIGAQLLGLGQLGDVAANIGTQLITLKFSRSDETEADLVGLELAARAGYNPDASVSLWKKMGQRQVAAAWPQLFVHPPQRPRPHPRAGGQRAQGARALRAGAQELTRASTSAVAVRRAAGPPPDARRPLVPPAGGRSPAPA
jgi:predicted Zn-dependent protease